MKNYLLVVFFTLTVIHGSHQSDAMQQLDCGGLADIVFILDSSGSIGDENFKSQLNFTAQIVSTLRESSTGSRFGLIEFSDNAIKEFDLKKYDTVEDIRQAILNVTYLRGGTYTGEALRLVITDQMFSEATGGRPDAPDIIITMTDGVFSDPDSALTVATALKATNVTMFTVGIGGGVNITELELMSTKPEYVVLAESFTTLETMLISLLNKTCSAIREQQGNVQIIPDVCKNGQLVNGVAQVPYPNDCTKVIQCYVNPSTKKIMAAIRRCPLGEFWDQANATCAPSWTVQCPFDKCSKECDLDPVWDRSLAEDDGSMTYAMPGSRRGYYACKNGKSYPRCCSRHNEYVRGVGCNITPENTGKCGVEKTCSNGVGVCQKIPLWENQKAYKEMSQIQGQYPTSCIFADFNIVGCSCDIRTLRDHYYNMSVCSSYFKANISNDCQYESYIVPLRRQGYKSPITLKFSLTMSASNFQIVTSPGSDCQDSFGLKVWGDEDTINVMVSNKEDKEVSRATVLWKHPTGALDVVVMLHSGLMTLGVTKDRYEIVTTVEAKLDIECDECDQQVKIDSGDKKTCILSQLEIFDCEYPFNSIYNKS